VKNNGSWPEGALDGASVFKADSIPAKRDETYMPKEVADALKKTEHWKNDYASKAAMSVGGGTQ
jgi:cytochrome c-type biogenesis protein CcmE